MGAALLSADEMTPCRFSYQIKSPCAIDLYRFDLMLKTYYLQIYDWQQKPSGSQCDHPNL